MHPISDPFDPFIAGVGGIGLTVEATQICGFGSLTDEELVRMAQGGYEEAEEHLLLKYRNIVRAKAKPYFLTGADHEDIVQEGLIGLHKAIRDFQEGKGIPFRNFAEICVSRQIITAIKSATRQKHTPLNFYISLNKPVFDEESDRTLLDIIPNGKITNPEELVMNREELDDIKLRLGKILSSFEYNVFLLYIRRASYQDIAKRLNTSTKAVDNALCRIKRKIEEKITKSS